MSSITLTPVRWFRNSMLMERLIYALIGIACVVRAWQVVRYNPMHHLWSDPLRHWTYASETMQSGPMAFFDPVAYQLWLSLVQKMSLGLPELIAVYAIFLSLATPWLWYRALREILTSKMLSLSGWAVLAWSPSWMVIFSYFMTETLFLPLLGLSLWMTCRADRKKTVGAFNLAVFCWSITILTRGIAAPMAGISLLLAWLSFPDKIKTALTSIILVSLLFLPLAYRNHHAVGLWSPLGNAWLNRIYAASGNSEIQLNLQHHGARWMYRFGSPSIGGKPFAPLSEWTSKRTGVVTVSADFAHRDKDWADALKQNSNMANGWIIGENLIHLFWGASWPDNNPVQLLARAQINQRWIWAPLFIFTILWSLPGWKWFHNRPIIPAVLIIWILFQGILLLAVNEGRYRKPGEGLIVAQLLLLIDRRNRSNKMNDKEKNP